MCLSSQDFWNFIRILGAIAIILSLYMRGMIPTYLAIFALLIVPIALALGGLTRFLIRVGLPLISLFILSLFIAGGGNLSLVFSGVITLAIILFTFYLFFRLLFGKH